jgi:2,4-dienoyl-CoA reductase (NADPH2)
MVPRGAFAWVTSRLKGSVSIPLVTTNRINTPEVSDKAPCQTLTCLHSQVADSILREGHADMVSMARYFYRPIPSHLPPRHSISSDHSLQIQNL